MTEEEKKLFEQAVEFFNKKDYDKSKSLYEEILKINPKNSAIYGNLGVIFRMFLPIIFNINHWSEFCY